jgi:cell cycle arrest protein BUB2
MTNLDLLLLKGASASNPEEALHELRYTILTEGIPANSEGMVRLHQNFTRIISQIGVLESDDRRDC